MTSSYRRLAGALLLAAGVTAAFALPAIAGTPLLPSQRGQGLHIALAAPALNGNGNGNGNNHDLGDDNSEERNIEGQILEINEDTSPPRALVGMAGGNVWARLYNHQLERSGLNNGDYVKMQGEYSDHGIFDAYNVDVVDRCCNDNGNGNGNGNGNNN
jgi:hypothetical protein